MGQLQSTGRMVLQLGDQLIRNEVIAVMELLKNSYDADASKCRLKFIENKNEEISEIHIIDDGFGMTREIIENSWLVIGSNYKQEKIKNLERTPKFGRLPIGEKGIGRFGLSKLGWNVELITKSEDDIEYKVNIDWNEFNENKSLKEINIEVKPSEENIYKNSTGTTLKITNLKDEWKRGRIRELYRQVLSLQSPFKKNNSFKIATNVPASKFEWIKDVPTINTISQLALFSAKFKIKENKITNFEYTFKPYEEMDRLEKREIVEIDQQLQLKGKNEVKEINLNSVKGLKEIEGEILIFDKSNKILKDFVKNQKALTKFLKKNGGIKVFRDGNRVYNYGEQGDDWLKLDRNRINAPSTTLGNDLVIGAIDIKRENSLGLQEKTNREGFIENATYEVFKEAITVALKKIENLRNEDKRLLKLIYDNKEQDEPVIGKLETLMNEIENLEIKTPKKEKLKDNVKQIQKEFEMVSQLMLKSATNGLSLSIVVHELEKRISELKVRILSDETIDRGVKSISLSLDKMMKNYNEILRSGKIKKQDLSNIIKKSLDHIEYRLRLHEFEVEEKYLQKAGITVSLKDSLMIGSIINIIDNSIYWIDKVFKQKNKKILIDIIKFQGVTGILIADNGKGFNISPELAKKPMISGKDEEGIGLGLFIVDECMKQQKGYLEILNNDDLIEEKILLTKEYKNGAKVFLGFKGE